jgi:hypothetical protein
MIKAFRFGYNDVAAGGDRGRAFIYFPVLSPTAAVFSLFFRSYRPREASVSAGFRDEPLIISCKNSKNSDDSGSKGRHASVIRH